LVVVILGLALITVGSLGQGNVSTGGFILVGPFPIVFGAGNAGGTVAVLSVLLGLVMLFLLYMGLRRVRAKGSESGAQNDNA
jgi:uncharacterized membrane protein